jgi:hypothetical protein
VVTETDLFDGPLGWWGAHVILTDPLGATATAAFQSFGTYIPAPGALVLLGLAGLTRNRKSRS